MRRMRRSTRLVAVACGLSLVIAACGGDDDDDSEATDPEATEAPTETEAPGTTTADTEAPGTTAVVVTLPQPPEAKRPPAMRR